MAILIDHVPAAEVYVDTRPMRRLNERQIIAALKGSRVAQSAHPAGDEPKEELFHVNGTYTLLYREPAVGSIEGRYSISGDRLCIDLRRVSCFNLYVDTGGALYRQNVDFKLKQRPERIYVFKGSSR